MRFPLLLAALLLGAAPGCSRPEENRPAPSPGPPQRIVALGATGVYETLLDLGAFDRIVAVTDRCHYPGSEGKVRIGGDAEGVPNVEAVLALAPDLVIVKTPARAALEAVGLRVLVVPEEDGLAALDRFVADLGAALGEEARAAEVLARMQSERERLREQTRGLPRVRVYYEEPGPFRTHARRSFSDELIALCGGVNVAHDLSTTHPVITSEFVVVADPEVIVLGAFTSPPHEVAARPGWSVVSAVRNGRVHAVRPDDRLLWSSRCAERGERLLLPWIHPDAAGTSAHAR